MAVNLETNLTPVGIPGRGIRWRTRIKGIPLVTQFNRMSKTNELSLRCNPYVIGIFGFYIFSRKQYKMACESKDRYFSNRLLGSIERLREEQNVAQPEGGRRTRTRSLSPGIRPSRKPRLREVPLLSISHAHHRQRGRYYRGPTARVSPCAHHRIDVVYRGFDMQPYSHRSSSLIVFCNLRAGKVRSM